MAKPIPPRRIPSVGNNVPQGIEETQMRFHVDGDGTITFAFGAVRIKVNAADEPMNKLTTCIVNTDDWSPSDINRLLAVVNRVQEGLPS